MWMRIGAATFAVGALAVLMVDAGMSSGCSRVTPEAAPKAVREPADPAVVAASAASAAPVAPAANVAPTGSALDRSRNLGEWGYLGASKSGAVVAPRQQQAASASPAP